MIVLVLLTWAALPFFAMYFLQAQVLPACAQVIRALALHGLATASAVRQLSPVIAEVLPRERVPGGQVQRHQPPAG